MCAINKQLRGALRIFHYLYHVQAFVLPRIPALTILFMCLLLACKKENPPVTADPSPPPVEEPKDTGIVCEELPPFPEPFGWTDSTLDENKNINAFFKNPLNGDELIIVVNGDATGHNKMFACNIRTRALKYLATLDDHLPDINQKGWIVFSSTDKNIFKVKANGDSLTQLTGSFIHTDAKWNRTGDQIFFFQDAIVFAEAQLLSMNAKGALTGGFPVHQPHHAPFRKSDRIIVQRVSNNHVTLLIRDLKTQSETELISAPYDTKKKQTPFTYVTVDHDDANIYWRTDNGIMRCNIATKTIDTLYKNCPNITHLRPCMGRKEREMTFSRHIVRPIGPFTLLHEYRCYEYDFTSGVLRELRVF